MQEESLKPQEQFKMSKMPYYIKNADGCELISNNRDFKLYLSSASHFDIDNNIERKGYSVRGFIKQGNGWEQGNISSFVNEIREYMEALRYSTDFSRAVTEYEKEEGIELAR